MSGYVTDCYGGKPPGRSPRVLSTQEGKAQQRHGKVGSDYRRTGIVLGQALAEEQAQQRDGCEHQPPHGQARSHTEQEHQRTKAAQHAGQRFEDRNGPEHRRDHAGQRTIGEMPAEKLDIPRAINPLVGG